MSGGTSGCSTAVIGSRVLVLVGHDALDRTGDEEPVRLVYLHDAEARLGRHVGLVYRVVASGGSGCGLGTHRRFLL
jgi:hypothetical protein